MPSASVARFLEACALNGDEAIKSAYTALQAAERDALAMNAAVMVFIDHHIGDPKQRAATYAMLTSVAAAQFDAMVDFLDQCFITFMDATLSPLTAPPAELVAALARV